MNVTELKARCGRAIAQSRAAKPYRTYHLAPDNGAITCLRCGLTSYHPMDITNLYCGNCHAFHEPGLSIRPELL